MLSKFYLLPQNARFIVTDPRAPLPISNRAWRKVRAVNDYPGLAYNSTRLRPTHDNWPHSWINWDYDVMAM